MEIQLDDLEDHLKPRSVLYFQSDGNDFIQPHHMICVAMSQDEVYSFVVCTSNEDKMERMAEKYGHETVVHIDPNDKDNRLTMATYINCNGNPIKHTKDDILNKFHNEPSLLKKCWVLPVGKFFEIIQGMRASNYVDEAEKELLPTLEEIMDGRFD